MEYIILRNGDIIEEGDEVLIKNWCKISRHIIGVPISADLHITIRRPIEVEIEDLY